MHNVREVCIGYNWSITAKVVQNVFKDEACKAEVEIVLRMHVDIPRLIYYIFVKSINKNSELKAVIITEYRNLNLEATGLSD